LAVQQGKIKSVDAKVADFEPRLRALNQGKDAGITWKHLASQTSGYGLSEMPGEAYAYNDYALALYYDTLVRKVHRQDGTRLLKEQLGDVLGFQDEYTSCAFSFMISSLFSFGFLPPKPSTSTQAQISGNLWVDCENRRHRLLLHVGVDIVQGLYELRVGCASCASTGAFKRSNVTPASLILRGCPCRQTAQHFKLRVASRIVRAFPAPHLRCLEAALLHAAGGVVEGDRHASEW
jgi:hypothetical protein